MGELRRIGDLEIDQDLDAQRREWRIEKLAWTCFALLILAGLSGLLGSGPLANAVAGEEGSELWVEYPRFARHLAPVKMRVVAARAGKDEVRLWIDRDYAERLELERISPEPDSVESLADRDVYAFRPGSGAGPLVIELSFELTYVGFSNARLGTLDGPSVEFRQLVYP